MTAGLGQPERRGDPRVRRAHTSDVVIAIAVVAVVGITMYLAFGMPGMDHGASSPPDENDTSTSVSASAATPILVDPAAFEAEMQDSDAFVVNVHTPYEGEIAGTDAFIRYDSIEQSSADLPTDRSAPLLVYCRSGTMSRVAAETLTEMGFVDVVELDGGMEAWAASGRAITSDS